MKLVQFSNKRTLDVKDLGKVVICSPTTGKIRLSPETIEALDLAVGDYVAVAGDSETGKNYIFKGEKNDKVQVGNKLSESGHYLEFGSSNAWDEIGGKTTHTVSHDLADEPVIEGGVKYFELVNMTEKEAKARTKSEDTAGEGKEVVETEDSKEVVEEVAEEVKEEVVIDAEEGFSLD